MLTAEVEMYWNSKQMEFFFTRAAVSRFLPMHTQAPYLVIDATLLSSSATLRVINAKLDNHHLHFPNTQGTQG